ncbi:MULTISPECIES: DUF3313 family protein [Sphingomonas]|uniref:DUF3313 domain-containing protein n=1 Tax=Edaphosphingomonas fennica TaxID=114404 RepID=A0A2T4I5C3_9SPHN|nr:MULTISPECIES: DUF3313 family protein [Sphingomonas]MDX3885403.1 DUF3313 family protein [Sphingomonas sp.]PTD25192.1 DUF3313 domain-containing protein [Sphingomonas fennica]
MLKGTAVRVAALWLLAALPATPSSAAKPPDTWDNLHKIHSKKMDYVYLLPGADFRTYTKVMLDPTEVAFEKNWLRDYNNSSVAMTMRLSDSDAQRILSQVQTGFHDILSKAYAKGGYQVVNAPGPDVLRLRTAVINLSVTAPDTMPAGRVRTFSRDAGGATLVLEARDSLSGAVLGRAVDSRDIGDSMPYFRNSVTNRGAFSDVFDRWAKISVDGLGELKAQSPIDADGLQKR